MLYVPTPGKRDPAAAGGGPSCRAKNARAPRMRSTLSNHSLVGKFSSSQVIVLADSQLVGCIEMVKFEAVAVEHSI